MPGYEWTCLRCVCHLREAILQRLTSQCLAWLAGMLFSPTLPEAVCRQWNGLAKPTKLNTAGSVPLAPSCTASLEQKGGQVTSVTLHPAWCSALRHGALNVVGKTRCWEECQGEVQRFWSRLGVSAQQQGQEQSFGSCYSPLNCQLQAQCPQYALSHGETGREEFPSQSIIKQIEAGWKQRAK